MNIKLDGKPATLTKLSPAQQKYVDFITHVKDGQLFTSMGLAAALNLSRARASDYANELTPPDHVLIDGSKKIYGNPKTLAVYRKARGLDA